MDDEKNRGFYEELKQARDGNFRLGDMESVECIDFALAEQGVKADVYHPEVDYHKAFDRTVEEAQRLSDAAYDAGLDKTGKDLNDLWRALQSGARFEGLIPREFI